MTTILLIEYEKIIKCAKQNKTKKWCPLWCLICIVFFSLFFYELSVFISLGPFYLVSLSCPTTPQVKKVNSVVLYLCALARHLVLWIRLTSRCLKSRLVAIQCWYPLSFLASTTGVSDVLSLDINCHWISSSQKPDRRAGNINRGPCGVSSRWILTITIT